MAQVIQPPSSILMGATGCGKTTALMTYLKAGIRTFVIGTEPGYVDSLLDAVKLHGVDVNLLHYGTCMPSMSGFAAIDAMTTSIGSMDFESLSKIKGIGKEETRKAAMQFLNLLKDFKCERTGKSFGDFTQRTDKEALVVDSLSGLSTIAWYLTVGYKPTGAPGEWNIAQNWLEAILLKINSDRKCFFTLTAHVEKEPNEITGVTQIMVSTLGRKLAPKVPRFFGDVIYGERTLKEGKALFTWSTVAANVDLKNRALPASANLEASFVPLVESYRRRLATAGSASPSPVPPPVVVQGATTPASPVAPKL